MQTTIDLTEEQLAQLKEFTGQENIADAVRTAVEEYIRYVLRMRLKQLPGQIEMQDNWREWEAAELAEQDDCAKPGAH